MMVLLWLMATATADLTMDPTLDQTSDPTGDLTAALGDLSRYFVNESTCYYLNKYCNLVPS